MDRSVFEDRTVSVARLAYRGVKLTQPSLQPRVAVAAGEAGDSGICKG